MPACPRGAEAPQDSMETGDGSRQAGSGGVALSLDLSPLPHQLLPGSRLSLQLPLPSTSKLSQLQHPDRNRFDNFTWSRLSVPDSFAGPLRAPLPTRHYSIQASSLYSNPSPRRVHTYRLSALAVFLDVCIFSYCFGQCT